MATLVRLKRIPVINKTHLEKSQRGYNYPAKITDLTNLQTRLSQFKELHHKIVSLDDFFVEKKLRPNWKQVIFRKRSESFKRDVGIYMDPLNVLPMWNNKNLEILCK